MIETVVFVAASGDEAVGQATREVLSAIFEAIEARGMCHLALAGGNTPAPLYRHMATNPRIPWERVHLYYGDERCVPPDHPESNHLTAMRALGQAVAARAAAVHRMEGERVDRGAAARAYEAVLPEALDVLLLGMGPDGHTASLFPGGEAVAEASRRVVAVKGPKPPPWRLTITAPVIRAARQRFVMAYGAAKAPTIARALQGPADPGALPVQLALPAVFLLDDGSASALERSRLSPQGAGAFGLC